MGWRDLKTGTKLAAGFGLILALLLAIGTYNILRVNASRKMVETATDSLHSFAFMIEKEVDHFKWINQVSTLFIDNSVSKLSVELDYHKCSLGRWIYSDEIQSKAATESVFAAYLDALIEPHIRLHESAAEIDDLFASYDQELALLISERWIDHLVWLGSLSESLLFKTPFSGETDHTACAFGQWFYGYQTDDQELAGLLSKLDEPHRLLHESAARITATVNSAGYESALGIYINDTKQLVAAMSEGIEAIVAHINRNADLNRAAYEVFQGKTLIALTDVQAELYGIREYFSEIASTSEAEMNAGFDLMIRLVTIALIAAAVLSTIAAIIITRGITVPLKRLTASADRIAVGDFAAEVTETSARRRAGTESPDNERFSRDEMGVLLGAFGRMRNALEAKARSLETIAEGDLSEEIVPLSENDGLGNSLRAMSDALNELIGNVNLSVEQVHSGSDQVSTSSQVLAQGATEQASTIEEISSSLTEISTQAQQTAENATEANGAAQVAKADAEAGNERMQELLGAIHAIEESSTEVKKIVKVIDDIAFQINLLALNANVEAARAGKYGKGFAVVAEEVRNLAARSANAVAETTRVVEHSDSASRNGAEMANLTVKQLRTIIDGTDRIATFLQEIEEASKEQAAGISQISDGLDQINQITQSNTASAEEGAAASEELASQAKMLQQYTRRFTLRDVYRARDTRNAMIEQISDDQTIDPHLVAF